MNMISGKTTLYLTQSDAAGNVGYSLAFNYKYEKDNSEATIEYSNIEFSGPGSWDDYSEGDDYPYARMLATAVSTTF